MMLNESILDAIKNRKYSLRPVNVEVGAPSLVSVEVGAPVSVEVSALVSV